MVDMLKLQAELSEEYGLGDEDWNGIKRSAILTFTLDNGGKVKSSYMNKHVFRHRDSEKTISLGETWICSLQSMGTYYFAKGLVRIDPSFLFELKKEQMDEIGSYIWEKYRHIIEPELKAKYDEEAEKKTNQATESIRNEYEDKIAGLNEEIDKLVQRDMKNKHVIASLEEELNTVSKHAAPAPAAPAQEQAFYPYPAQPVRVSVRRDGPDSIYSESFNRSRYFVHLSYDRRTILIKAHEEGNVLCMNNRIVLEGLSAISTFGEQYDMVTEYNPRYGGIQIYL